MPRGSISFAFEKHINTQTNFISVFHVSVTQLFKICLALSWWNAKWPLTTKGVLDPAVGSVGFVCY